MNPMLRSQYVRFMIGGALCAGINNVMLIIGNYFGVHYIPLTFMFYLTSGTVGYIFHSRITFENEMTVHGYVSFMVGICLGLPVSLIILAILTEWLALPMWVAAPTMTVILIAYHYLIARLAITRRLVAPTTLATAPEIPDEDVPQLGGGRTASRSFARPQTAGNNDPPEAA